jgi:hypothetical protein
MKEEDIQVLELLFSNKVVVGKPNSLQLNFLKDSNDKFLIIKEK